MSLLHTNTRCLRGPLELSLWILSCPGVFHYCTYILFNKLWILSCPVVRDCPYTYSQSVSDTPLALSCPIPPAPSPTAPISPWCPLILPQLPVQVIPQVFNGVEVR